MESASGETVGGGAAESGPRAADELGELGPSPRPAARTRPSTACPGTET